MWYYTDVASDSTIGDEAWSIIKSEQSSQNITMDLTPPPLKLVTTTASLRSKSSYNTLQRLFSDVGIATDLVAQRTQPQPLYDQLTKSCVLRTPDANTTDVDRLNSGNCGAGGKYQLTELILASTFANGLSRYGSRRAFNLAASPDNRSNPFKWDLKKPPRAPGFAESLLSLKPKHSAVLPAPPGSNFVTRSMKCEVAGYAWYASSSSDYLAAGVVMAYMLIAIAYTVWVLFVTDVTSSSWDTVTELLALALQSPVPETMSGSGAGVERFATYSRLVRLRARREEGGGRQRVHERLVFVVGDEKISGNVEEALGGGGRGGSVRHRKVMVDEEYL